VGPAGRRPCRTAGGAVARTPRNGGPCTVLTNKNQRLQDTGGCHPGTDCSTGQRSLGEGISRWEHGTGRAQGVNEKRAAAWRTARSLTLTCAPGLTLTCPGARAEGLELLTKTLKLPACHVALQASKAGRARRSGRWTQRAGSAALTRRGRGIRAAAAAARAARTGAAAAAVHAAAKRRRHRGGCPPSRPRAVRPGRTAPGAAAAAAAGAHRCCRGEALSAPTPRSPTSGAPQAKSHPSAAAQEPQRTQHAQLSTSARLLAPDATLM
jgi:hypothetical protein